MSLENSITDLNASVQTLIQVMSAQNAHTPTPVSVKQGKPSPAKTVELITPVALAESDANFPSLEVVIDEMRGITDRPILDKLMIAFNSKRASDIPEDRRSAFIEAIHVELQQGAA